MLTYILSFLLDEVSMLQSVLEAMPLEKKMYSLHI